MPYIDDKELEELKKARPSSGNESLDFYWLGYEAGEASAKTQYEDSRGTWIEMFNKKNEAEKERDAAKAEVDALKAKVKKLKKKLKGGA